MSDSHQSNWDRLGEFVTQMMEEKGVPGVAVGILHQGEMASAGFGVTSVDNPLPVTDGTLFQIGSITKSFTATIAMQLIEEDAFQLYTPISEFFPELPGAERLDLADHQVVDVKRPPVAEFHLISGGGPRQHIDLRQGLTVEGAELPDPHF